MGFLVAACMRDLVPGPGIEPRPPALGAWSLTHWTTRGSPSSTVKDLAIDKKYPVNTLFSQHLHLAAQKFGFGCFTYFGKNWPSIGR